RGRYAATLRLVATRSCIGPRRRSGTRSDAPAARRSPSSPRTTRCATTCRSASPARSPSPTASRRRARMCAGWAVGMVAAATGARAVPGHWEGDLILGLESSAIGTLVERTTRFTMLLHLPRMGGHGDQPREKNGPSLSGHGAEAVRDAITATITTLPEQLRRSLTWDQGTEMAQHPQ